MAASNSAPHQRLSDLSGQQWRSGVAAWLGWLFDGLDMHLYTMVATKFVAELLGASSGEDPQVKTISGIIQAAFLFGWAIGGGFFGQIGDRLGRSRALSLTILTYAIFTGLSFFATTWQFLLVCRFVAALGIGGEWAVGASLLSETWPPRWRAWLAAVLQSAVNVGNLLASGLVMLLAAFPPRTVFLVGVLPALLVFWIRRSVPEPDEWLAARHETAEPPRIADLFRGEIRRTTILTIVVCSLSLTAHWAFMFWHAQHLRALLPAEGSGWADPTAFVATGFGIVMIASIAGNFLAGWIANQIGYRLAVAAMCASYFASLAAMYGTPRDHTTILAWLVLPGLSQGVFALFTMYLPPLFPTLLRTTGAGFCYNIGRIAAAGGTIAFGIASLQVDYRLALFGTSFLFLPAAVAALYLPEPPSPETTE
jgi:MFS family permease